jgi:selenocysteine-specific elongation factor
MPVVGTAGHVDHGKSALVQALTGRDPDRWEEEKRRGLTIDLGFAWTQIDDTEVGFVDVPGHERFIKNMLAGIDAVDAALFVVAADEGWKPQSEEHLIILDLFGIDSGVVALTRADLVDDERLELVALDVQERLRGTSMAGSAVIATAAPEGRGITEIRTALQHAISASARPEGTRPRLWIDRAFTIGGAGTVVTGTLRDGPVTSGDTLALWPAGTPVRVRGLQTHERPVEHAAPQNRVALNLAGTDRSRAPRGSMIGRPGDWAPTSRLLAQLRCARYIKEPLRDRGAFHLHIGTAARRADIRLLEGADLDTDGAALIRINTPLALKIDDRFILRDVGRRLVVAGGTVLDPHPPPRAAQARPALTLLRPVAATPDTTASALLQVRGHARLDVLAADSGGGAPTSALTAAGAAWSPAAVNELLRRAQDILATFHEANPLRAGMPRASLTEPLGISIPELEGLAETSDVLVVEGPVVRLATFSATLDEHEEAAWQRARAALRASGLTPPRRGELGLHEELLHALLRRGQLVTVSEDLVYLPETLDDLRTRLSELEEPFTVAVFRDTMGMTRKHAVPLLEWLDARGITHRRGDLRYLRP